MSQTNGPLRDDELSQIEKIVEVMERSNFDFMQVELGDLKLTLSKGELPVGSAESVASAQPRAAGTLISAATVSTPAAIPPVVPPGPVAPPVEQVAAAHADPEDDTLPIPAPIVGRFYAQPEPGAPPFVTVGTEVDEDTTVALIEVMKVFNAVRAGCRGVISEVCVQDAQFVEYGQVLFRVRPAQTADAAATPADKGASA